ncbi:MAG: cytidine deaminase [Sphingobacteriaceae bacterium]|nr:cytidine deaminase [Sphingobacteriaceae bacterium]
MAKHEIKKVDLSFEVYQSENDLEASDQLLLNKAKEMAKNAYAPYSKFKVGAALLLENGTIVTGNNQENAAYPSGTCAERTAVFYASAQYPTNKIKAIAVITDNVKQLEPVTPCGSCRQALAEYEIKFREPIRVIMGSASGKVYIAKSVESLLPLMFNQDHLK